MSPLFSHLFIVFLVLCQCIQLTIFVSVGGSVFLHILQRSHMTYLNVK